MSDARFTVDTNPLARELSSVSDEVSSTIKAVDRTATAVEGTSDAVHGTTSSVNTTIKRVKDTQSAVKETTVAVGSTIAAVESMRGQVVKAEEEAAQKVSRHVTSGFVSLIRAELAQKKVEVQTHVMSKCQVLGHFGQMLQRRQKQLQDDYERITKRYAKIIDQLNEALKSRIYMLDAPAAEVSDQGYGVLEKRVLVNGAALPIFEQNALPLSNHVGIAHCKEDCSKALVVVKDLVIHLQRLRRAMEASVREVRIEGKRRWTMPMLIMEAEDPDVVGTKKTELVFGGHPEQKAQEKNIRSEYYEHRNSFHWCEAGAGREQVRQRIEDLAAAAQLDERTRKWVMQLADSSAWQELGAIG